MSLNIGIYFFKPLGVGYNAMEWNTVISSHCIWYLEVRLLNFYLGESGEP